MMKSKKIDTEISWSEIVSETQCKIAVFLDFLFWFEKDF